jgi:hypothetical protein
MNAFLFLKNVYVGIIVAVISWNEERGKLLPFWVIQWFVNLLWTAFLLVLIPYIVIRIAKRAISDKDAEESRKEVEKRLAILRELSYYEWRNSVDVFIRVARSHCLVKEVYVEEEIVVASEVLDFDPDTILIDLIHEANLSCEMRQETKEEYVDRKLSGKFRRKPLNRKQEIKLEIRKQRVAPTFEKQFDIIERAAGENIFKSLYLGRWLVFKKKATGTGKRNPPKESPLPNAV